MPSFTLRCKMIPNIHLNRDSLIPKSQFDLIFGKLSITVHALVSTSKLVNTSTFQTLCKNTLRSYNGFRC